MHQFVQPDLSVLRVERKIQRWLAANVSAAITFLAPRVLDVDRLLLKVVLFDPVCEVL